MSELSVVHHNLAALDQGICLLRGLPSEAYGAVSAPESSAAELPAIGPHLRHCIDFYHCFLDGYSSGRIDYSARRRDTRIEVDPLQALYALEHIQKRLAEVAEDDLARPLDIRLDSSVDETDEHTRSTIGRELQFLLSHTIHHYAFVGLILRVAGQSVPEDFGVAPSTLSHRRREMECAR